jgi:uncharacterized protein YjbJ (UPF0337 family)
MRVRQCGGETAVAALKWHRTSGEHMHRLESDSIRGMSLAFCGDAPAGRDVPPASTASAEQARPISGPTSLAFGSTRYRCSPRHNWSQLQEDRMMDERAKGVKNQVVGATKEAAGKLRDAAADITGDTSEQIKGKAQVVEGKVQSAVGRAEEKLGAKKDQNRDVNKDMNKGLNKNRS